MKNTQKYYLYKEHCDKNAYGEEITELFADKEDAKSFLKERIEEAYDVSWDEIPDELGLEEDDTFTPEYVSINNGDGTVSYWVIEEKELRRNPKTDMTSSHSEKEIYKGCLALMYELFDIFKEWLEFIGYDTQNPTNEEESFCYQVYPTHIIERLFLWGTTHSGGTSRRMKCRELGIDDDQMITFDFTEGSEEK